MRTALPLLLVVVTVLLMAVGLTAVGRPHGTVGIASGSALLIFNSNANPPEQDLSNFLIAVQRRNWDRAFSSVERTNDSVNEHAFIQEGIGSNGGRGSFSNLEGYDGRPL